MIKSIVFNGKTVPVFHAEAGEFYADIRAIERNYQTRPSGVGNCL